MQKLGSMEEENGYLLNFDQEDDNLLGISSGELGSGVNPLLPTMTPCKLKPSSAEFVANHPGKEESGGVTAAEEADCNVKQGPAPTRFHMVPNSVLSVLNFNEMNKRKIEETGLRKGLGIKESMQLDGICETSPVRNPGDFTSQLSRSYLDIENDQLRGTAERAGCEPTVLRKSRSRRSTTLRKSLAWDKAFFTDEGVLDNDELFAVASDNPKTLPMPELATIWDGPQNVIAPFEARTTPIKTPGKPAGLTAEVKAEVRSEGSRSQVEPEVRPGNLKVEPKPTARPAPNSKLQHDVPPMSSLRPDVLHSIRPVRHTQRTGSHAFSNAYSRAAAIPQGSSSIPVPTNLSRTGKQSAGRSTIEHAPSTDSDMKEPRNSSIVHQARIAALKKAHEVPAQRGPRVRLPSVKMQEDKPAEETHKTKLTKKVDVKPLVETHKSKPFKKVDLKDEGYVTKQSQKVEEPQKMKQPSLNRSLSTPTVLESPSALSRKMSSMSRKVKETLEKVMTGRARRVLKEPSLSHVHPVDNTSLSSKKLGMLPKVPEVKDSNHRTRSNSTVGPSKTNKEPPVRDTLRSKGPPLSPKAALAQAPTLTRSKSVCAVPGLPKATDSVYSRRIAPSAPPPTSLPGEPAGKPTGLRKPSPKLGFFDTGRATSISQKISAIPEPFQSILSTRAGTETSAPGESQAQRLYELAPVKVSSAIPSAPHLRYGVASAPTSPKSIRVSAPSSPKCLSTTTTRPSSPVIERVALPVYYSGIRHAMQFADSHQLLAKRMQTDSGNDEAREAAEVFALDSFKLPEALSGSSEPNTKPAMPSRERLPSASVDWNSSVPPARGGSSLELDKNVSHDNGTHTSLLGQRTSECLVKLGEEHLENYVSLKTTEANSTVPVLRSTTPVPGLSVFEESNLRNCLSAEHISKGMVQTCDSPSPETSAMSGLPDSGISGRKPPDTVSQFNQRPGQDLGEVPTLSPKPAQNTSSPNVQETNVEGQSMAVNACQPTRKACGDSDLPSSACPNTPASKERSRSNSAKLTRQFESPRSKSFRETSYRTQNPSDSPRVTNKYVRSFSQRQPWQSPSGTVGGDESPSFCPSTFGNRLSSASPSHAPDVGGTFEVLTPTNSRNACGARTPGSSSKKVVRKIVEFESPSARWCDWPVLGAVLSEDQLSVPIEESTRPALPATLEEQALNLPTDSQPNSSVNLLNTPSVKVRHVELDRAADRECILATDQSTISAPSCSMGDEVTPMNIASAAWDSASVDGNRSIAPNGEQCGSVKKERSSSMFSFARKAVARLTSSPTPAEPSGQDNEGTPKLRKTSRRFSKSGSYSTCPAPEPKPLSPFSEARICELEAAGPEILEKKTGPVQNSPPDKVVPDTNPWSPVKKNAQPLGPFDCTKLKYISPGLVAT